MADSTIDNVKNIRFVYATIIPLVSFLLYHFLIKKDTDVGVISTYNGLPMPSKWEVNNAINTILFRKRKEKIQITKDLSSQAYNKNNLEKFIVENTSKIEELSHFNNVISLFLFAHMPVNIYLGYKIGKTKTVELYHQLRNDNKNIWKWLWIFLTNTYKKK